MITTNTALNECVYLYSVDQFYGSDCPARKKYWATIHLHRAQALGKKILVSVPIDLPNLLKPQAI